ncbi:MAG: histidinol dehydrogenase [Saprospiraceae bacterium]|jgi:histidinol dehydrogenase
MKIYKYPSSEDQKSLIKRPTFDKIELEEVVKGILEDVKTNGDSALKKYAAKFDKVELSDLEVSQKEIEEAISSVSEELKNAIQIAAKNINIFHVSQKENSGKVETMPGVKCWRKSVGIEKVGLYIPGGTAPLFSTVLMLGIPAKIAECQEVILCSPPNKSGKIHPAVLYAANLVGITRIFKSGGAQAIAAMAYGTESIPTVYKIFGPGNQFVTKAKELVQQDGLAIDMPAGPSEVLVIADETSNPAFVAADLLSQAEHGIDSQVVTVCDNEDVLQKINAETMRQLENLPRKTIAAKALESSFSILVKATQESIDFSNAYAPEHLIIASKNADLFIDKIRNAGSVFLGNYSCESAGDYASGTNHTLPTNGFANNYSGVSLDSFVKKITFQKITKEGIKNLGKTIEIMAEAEQLFAHKNAVTLRLKSLENEI